MLTTVYFYTVKSPKDKLKFLYEKAYFHFRNKDPLLILCQDDKTINFVDNLLWSHKPEAFIPHEILGSSSSEFILLSEDESLFKEKYIFNLKKSIPFSTQKRSLIYDFEDFTSPEKEKSSAEKYREYKNLGCQIVVF